VPGSGAWALTAVAGRDGQACWTTRASAASTWSATRWAACSRRACPTRCVPARSAGSSSRWSTCPTAAAWWRSSWLCPARACSCTGRKTPCCRRVHPL